jgi:hypothetical protein
VNFTRRFVFILVDTLPDAGVFVTPRVSGKLLIKFCVRANPKPKQPFLDLDCYGAVMDSHAHRPVPAYLF